MKNLLKKVLSVAAATALLMTSVISASAETITDDATGYRIEIFRPRDTDVKHPSGFKLGAYQLFTGKVPADPATSEYNTGEGASNPGWYITPGTSNDPLPLTDIKWGNAFGNLSVSANQTNLVNYIKALATANDDKFPGIADKFKDLYDVTGDKLATTYYEGSNIRFDALANAVAERLAKITDRKTLQYFADITAGYGTAPESYVKNYYAGKNNYSTSTEAGILKGTEPVWTFQVPAGYYLIKDLTTDAESTDSYSYSASMLFVAGNVIQTLKSSVPAVTKDILERDASNTRYTLKDTTVAGVGDQVKFILRGSLPSNFDKFVGYKYEFHDTMSKGLSFVYEGGDSSSTDNVNHSVRVAARGAWFNATTDDLSQTGWEWKAAADIEIPAATSDTSSDGYYAKVSGQDISVKFANLRELTVHITESTDTDTPVGYYRLGYNYNAIGEDPGKEESFGGAVDANSSTIRVIYAAEINKEAIVNPKDGTSENGNNNVVYLSYSNDPQNWSDTDNTVTTDVTVYTFGLDLYKFDYAKRLAGETENEKLKGAKFAILREVADAAGGTSHWQIAQVTEEITDATSKFGENSYRSILEWNDLTDDGGNVSTNVTGKDLIAKVKDYIENNSGKVSTGDAPTIFYEISTNDKGNAYLSGLDAEVTYTFVETVLPDNTYAQLMPFTVSFKADTETNDGVTEYTGKIGDITVTPAITDEMSMDHYVKSTELATGDAEGICDIEVVNFQYDDLPSTGGIGVYIYYIAGGCIVALALVLFALSKKKKTTK